MSEQTILVPKQTLSYLQIKRFGDVVLSTIVLILFAPLYLLIAILIKLDSEGPVFFIHERMGSYPYRSGDKVVWIVRPFRMVKFRSMYHSSDETPHQGHIQSYIQESSANGNNSHDLKTPHDPRITRVGRILRKTSLDELPQFWNVLIGDMSLVGPRPIPIYEYELYSAEAKRRFEAMQGITGLWQVGGRCELSFSEQIALDIEYIKQRSLWLDFKILLLTLPAVIFGRGAE